MLVGELRAQRWMKITNQENPERSLVLHQETNLISYYMMKLAQSVGNSLSNFQDFSEVCWLEQNLGLGLHTKI